jgi:hypothetical protein
MKNGCEMYVVRKIRYLYKPDDYSHSRNLNTKVLLRPIINHECIQDKKAKGFNFLDIIAKFAY